AERVATNRHDGFCSHDDRVVLQIQERVRRSLDDDGVREVIAEERGGQCERSCRSRPIPGGAATPLSLERTDDLQTRQARSFGVLGQRGWRKETAADRDATVPPGAVNE